MTTTDRSILHVDMDAFYAAVEQRDDPTLRGKPVLIGGSGSRGVVATASYEARVFGCHSAQPTAMARHLCPQAIIVRGRHGHYSEVSRQVFEILESFTPIVEPLSIDEAFMDVTGSHKLFGPPESIARAIRSRIKAELGLTASVGVSFNKYLAKLASDLDKPDGLVVISRDNIERVLPPLRIERLWGVGPATARRLHRLGIRTVGDVRATPVETLKRHVGNLADRLAALSRGQDFRPVTPDSSARSISHEQTFGKNIDLPAAVRAIVMRQAEDVARRLRRHALQTRHLSLKIRYGDFETINRSMTLEEPTGQTLILRQAAADVFDRWAARDFRSVRLVGFAAQVEQPGSITQPALFDDPGEQRETRLDTAMDSIVDRFGRDSIRRGG